MNLSRRQIAQWLAQAEYAALLPNPRRSYGRSKRFADAVRGAVGKDNFGDVMVIVEAMVAAGIADSKPLGIGGWSQGLHVGMHSEADRPLHFMAAIMGVGVSDWGLMIQTSDVPNFEWKLGGSAPWNGVEHHPHATISPISFARSVKTPVLLLH